jgi:membrane-bound inhibitor of C-type lysozyme
MRPLLASALLAAAALTGCASPIAPPTTPITVAAVYRCDDGQTLRVTFDNSRNDARVILGDGAITTLQGQPVGSGIHYANAVYDLRGKGREATFAVKDGASTTCLAED